MDGRKLLLSVRAIADARGLQANEHAVQRGGWTLSQSSAWTRTPASGVFGDETSRMPGVWTRLGSVCPCFCARATGRPALILSVGPPKLDGWLLTEDAGIVPLSLKLAYFGLEEVPAHTFPGA